MGLLKEDFLDNMDNRSSIGDEEVGVSEDVKTPQDYPFMFKFLLSLYSYNKNPKKFLAKLNRLKNAIFIKSSSDIVDKSVGSYMSFYIGFEPDFKSVKNIFQMFNMCYRIIPVMNDVMYIVDTGHNEHKIDDAWSIFFNNLNIYMNYTNKGLLMLEKPSTDSFQKAVQKMMESASMLLPDEKKLKAAHDIEDIVKCNVFQRMTKYINRNSVYSDYRI